MFPKKDLTSNRYGKLVVIDFNGRDNAHKSYWNCQCDCGNVYVGRSDHLMSGKVSSCGCNNKKKRGHRTPEGHTSFIKLYSNYKCSARKRGLEFSLSKEQFKELVVQDCYYCGSPPSGFYLMRGANGGILYNGLDRVKSSLGYTLDNVVPCCGMCNRAKYDMDIKEFMIWINRLINKSVQEERTVYLAYRDAA